MAARGRLVWGWALSLALAASACLRAAQLFALPPAGGAAARGGAAPGLRSGRPQAAAGASPAASAGLALFAAAASAAAAAAARARLAGRGAAEGKAAESPVVEEEAEVEVEVALGEDGLPLDIEFDGELPKPKPFDPADQVGVTAPLGYFDPLNFCKEGDLQEYRRLRAAEIKHGRVAMLASVGLLAQHWIRLPGFEAAKNTFASQLDVIFKPPAIYGFSVSIVILMFTELSLWTQIEDREPGDFGDPLGLNMYDTDMRNREINNGRFAMICTVGIIAAQALTGRDAAQQLGLA